MDTLLAAIGSSAVAGFLRSSIYVYPLANAAHILGFAVLVGAIFALDARILGFARAIPLAEAARLLVPVAIGGLILALAAGVAIFSVKPKEYAENPVFLVKIGLIALAIVNALALRLRPAWWAALAGGPVGAGIKVSAVLSIAFWTGALLAGRLIAFFGY